MSLVFPCIWVHGSKKNLPLSRSDLNLVNFLISYSGELCNKNCIVKTSETLIIWSASCYTAGSGRWDAIKGVPDRRLKRAAMVLRAEQGMGHSEWPMTQVTHWALDPWPMWPMTHGSPGPSPLTSATLHRFIDYPALYLDIVYTHTFKLLHVSKLHTQAAVKLEFANWKLKHCIT